AKSMSPARTKSRISIIRVETDRDRDEAERDRSLPDGSHAAYLKRGSPCAARAARCLARLEETLGHVVFLRAAPTITRAVDLLERAALERLEGEVECLSSRRRDVGRVQRALPGHLDRERAASVDTAPGAILVTEPDVNRSGRAMEVPGKSVELLTDQPAERPVREAFDDDRHRVSLPRTETVELSALRAARSLGGSSSTPSSCA